MRTTLITLFAIVFIGFVSPAVASARRGFHGSGAVSWGGGWGADYRWHGPDWWGVIGVGGYGYGYPYGYAPYYDSGCFLYGSASGMAMAGVRGPFRSAPENYRYATPQSS